MQDWSNTLEALHILGAYQIYQGAAQPELTPGCRLLFSNTSLYLLDAAKGQWLGWAGQTCRGQASLDQPELPHEQSWILAKGLGQAAVFAAIKAGVKFPMTLVIADGDHPFLFIPKPAQMMAAQLPNEMIGTWPVVEELGQVNRLIHTDFMPGCLEGDIHTAQSLVPPATPWHCWQ